MVCLAGAACAGADTKTATAKTPTTRARKPLKTLLTTSPSPDSSRHGQNRAKYHSKGQLSNLSSTRRIRAGMRAWQVRARLAVRPGAWRAPGGPVARPRRTSPCSPPPKCRPSPSDAAQPSADGAAGRGVQPPFGELTALRHRDCLLRGCGVPTSRGTDRRGRSTPPRRTP